MRYVAYSQAEFPPFPTVWIQFSYLFTPRRAVAAKLDTGATVTLAPTSVLHEAGAPATGQIASCVAYDGLSAEWPVFEVNLEVVDARWPEDVQREFRQVLVLGVDGQAEVLLGRDVLAAWYLHLDGPNSRYSVE